MELSSCLVPGAFAAEADILMLLYVLIDEQRVEEIRLAISCGT